ncbi:Mov34/MPN/PAD-1 family protein [Advenella sp. RU8]|uniref:Mov34/MPN/PAD-1 family protein n=1 Tax=Advenella sp. RU8 TaxID=3399575 RepID=UPI003AAE935A
MIENSLQYQIARAQWKLEVPEHVTQFLAQHVQISRKGTESVGQLYSRNLTSDTIIVDKATLLKPARTQRTRVQFPPGSAMAERKNMFTKGLHCIGLWHSHPEPIPTPSHEDLELASDYAHAAKRQLSGIIFAILGTAPFPTGLAIWIHDGLILHEANPLNLLSRNNINLKSNKAD